MLAPEFPVESAYAVALAYRVRYSMQMNARSAMHIVELRSSPQGHPAYRWVAQEMHRLIAEGAGHRLLAEAMSHVDYGEAELERLESERRAETRRAVSGDSLDHPDQGALGSPLVTVGKSRLTTTGAYGLSFASVPDTLRKHRATSIAETTHGGML